MPADISLSAVEVSLVNALSRELILRSYTESVQGQYDYIIIGLLEKWKKEQEDSGNV